jgi:hypothetical protein
MVMTNISEDIIAAALAAVYPHIWSAPGVFQSNLPQSAARADELRERMIRALEAAVALTPLPERSEEAQDLAIELGRLAARVARLAPVQPAPEAPEQPVFTPVPPGHSPEAQLIADFYTEVKTDKMGTVTGFELGALDGRLIEVRDELKRVRELAERGERALRDVRQEATRQIAVSTSRIELLNEEIRSLNRKLTVKAAPAPEAKSTKPPPSDDPMEKMFDTVLGWAERGLDAINTKLSDDKKKDESS